MKLILSKNKIKNKVYKSSHGYYSYEDNKIYIHLFNHKLSGDYYDFIADICDTIIHENLHSIIWNIRKDYGNDYIFDYFEEMIIARFTNQDFDEEDYYYLVQFENE